MCASHDLFLAKIVECFHELTKLNLSSNYKDQIDKIETIGTKMKSHPNYKGAKCNLPCKIYVDIYDVHLYIWARVIRVINFSG